MKLSIKRKIVAIVSKLLNYKEPINIPIKYQTFDINTIQCKCLLDEYQYLYHKDRIIANRIAEELIKGNHIVINRIEEDIRDNKHIMLIAHINIVQTNK